MRAIVLERRDIKEVDQRITVLTQTEGKKDFIARGIKKSVSKNSPHLEPCTYVEIEVAPGKTTNYIAKAHAVDVFPAVRSSYEKSLTALRAANLVNRLVGQELRESKVFFLLLSFLLFLEEGDVYKDWYLSVFVLKLASLLGFTPSLGRCMVTEEETVVAFDIERGGLVSQKGIALLPKESRIVFLAPPAIEALRLFMDVEWSGLSDIVLSEKDATALTDLIYRFVRHHTETGL